MNLVAKNCRLAFALLLALSASALVCRAQQSLEQGGAGVELVFQKGSRGPVFFVYGAKAPERKGGVTPVLGRATKVHFEKGAAWVKWRTIGLASSKGLKVRIGAEVVPVRPYSTKEPNDVALYVLDKMRPPDHPEAPKQGTDLCYLGSRAEARAYVDELAGVGIDIKGNT